MRYRNLASATSTCPRHRIESGRRFRPRAAEGKQALADKVKIDADELTEVRLSADGTRVLMSLRNDRGDQVSLSMPACCLNAVLSVAPRHAEPGSVHRLDNWTMAVADNGQDLLLTLRSPEGLAISFALKPWQVEGMATIAAHGNTRQPPPKNLH
jgi:hypothetical protein